MYMCVNGSIYLNVFMLSCVYTCNTLVCIISYIYTRIDMELTRNSIFPPSPVPNPNIKITVQVIFIYIYVC